MAEIHTARNFGVGLLSTQTVTAIVLLQPRLVAILQGALGIMLDNTSFREVYR